MTSAVRDDRPGWHLSASCAGHMGSAFYPPLRPERRSAKLAREARAKEVCTTCSVRADCLRHALDAEERFGIWGGLNPAERTEIAGDPTTG